MSIMRLATSRQQAEPRPWRAALLALLCVGALLYFALVYLPTLAQFNREHGYSGGYGSDLYSRWYGSRELLQHGRDPYSPEITAEMQRGFVGRDAQPGEQVPEWAVFAQPIYTVLLIAPLTTFDFPTVQALATIIFPLLIGLGALLWLPALDVPRTPPNMAVAFLLAVSAPATLYGANLQQLSAVVFLLLALALWLVARGNLAWAGLPLALATIKPQESGLMIALLLAWALFDLKGRRWLLISFAGSMVVLMAVSELLLPGWLPEFLSSLTRYSANTGDLQLFAAMLPGAVLALFAALWVALLGRGAWNVRREPGASRWLALAAAAALAITVILIPAYLQYERIFLLPALFALLWCGDLWPSGRRMQLLYRLTLGAMLLPWLLAAPLGFAALLGLVGPALLPFLPYLLLPYLAAACLLAPLWRRQR